MHSELSGCQQFDAFFPSPLSGGPEEELPYSREDLNTILGLMSVLRKASFLLNFLEEYRSYLNTILDPKVLEHLPKRFVRSYLTRRRFVEGKKGSIRLSPLRQRAV